MAQEINPFLMFPSGAEQAMNFYISLFPGSRIEKIERFDAPGPGVEGSVKLATLNLLGRKLEFFDSPVRHAFTFTPAISFFIDCESETQLRDLAAALGEGGGFMMPLGNYGFSQLFCWLADRFGVSWQLNLA